MPDDRSERKITCGFLLSFLLYSVYILCGVAVIVLQYRPAVSDGEALCRKNLQLYAGIGALAALRSLIGLCRSYYMYLRKQRPYPTEQELWMRVVIKLYVVIHGLTLFIVFGKSHDLQATQAVAYRLWLFFSITLWANVVSISLVPFSLEASLLHARRIQLEEQQDSRVQAATASQRPLSNIFKMYHVQEEVHRSNDGLGQGGEEGETSPPQGGVRAGMA